MAKTYNRLEIDVNKKPTDIITAVQADSNSRFLDVSLFNNGVPLDLTGHEVKIFMKKPENGGEIWNDGVITDAKKGRCEFLMTTEALAKMGHLQTQISVWKENTEILSTQVFEINVTKTLLGESAVESSNEYGTLVLLFQNLYETHALMTDMVSAFGSKGAVANARNIATFWQGVEYLAKYMDTDLKGKIDAALANSSVQGVLDLIGTSGDSENSTVMGKLKEVLNEAKKSNGILYVASDNVLKTIINSEVSFVVNTAGQRIGNDYLMYKASGMLRFTVSLTKTSDYGFILIVYVNGNEVGSFSATKNSYSTYTADILVSEGDIISLKARGTGSYTTGSINLLTISATKTDAPNTAGMVQI